MDVLILTVVAQLENGDRGTGYLAQSFTVSKWRFNSSSLALNHSKSEMSC